jgi:hypothetical protein
MKDAPREPRESLGKNHTKKKYVRSGHSFKKRLKKPSLPRCPKIKVVWCSGLGLKHPKIIGKDKSSDVEFSERE